MPEAYLSLSHDILREYREYERMSTTVVNAYIGPKVGGYVAGLESSLQKIGFAGELSIMRSNGGVMTPEVATSRPVAMMESGPVGGIIASARFGRMLGQMNVISFDMGGTTAKASLVKDGEPTLAPGYYVGGYASGHPVMLPMIDVVEVGAGGGSIAWIDDIGALEGRPAERRRGARSDLLPHRRHRADHHGRQCRPRPARSRQLPRRDHEARCRRRPHRHRSSHRRSTRDGHDRRRQGDRRHRHLQDVARRARGVGREGLRPARLRARCVGRRRSAARHRRSRANCISRP